MSRTLWLGKALPRDWLAVGEAPLDVRRLTTRYGRVSLAMQASQAQGAAYTVHVNVSVPASFGTAAGRPQGGVRVRIRAPIEYAGRLSAVTVGGAAWSAFTAAEETIDFEATTLNSLLAGNGLIQIVAWFT